MILGTYVNLNEVDVKTGSHSDRQEHLDVQQTREKVFFILNWLNKYSVKSLGDFYRPLKFYILILQK